MSEPRSIVISANPRSGATSGLELANALRDRLESAGYGVELFTEVLAMEQRARELQELGTLRTVIAAGGDGTASLVLSRIPPDVPLTLFPLGSENLLAQYFGIDRNLERTLERIHAMQTLEMDLFHANGSLTLLMTSAGFDAEVVRHVHANRTSHVTRWRYRWAILKAMWSYDWPRFQISLCNARGEWEDKGEFHWFFAFNVPKYAAGISIIGEASISDGLLEVGTFRGGGLWRGLWNYAMVFLKRHHQTATWRRFQASGVRLEVVGDGDSSAVQVPYQIDGDWGGMLPLEIKFSGRRARLVVSPQDLIAIDRFDGPSRDAYPLGHRSEHNRRGDP